MLFLLHGVNDCFEGVRVVDGKVSKDFAVEIDAFFLHSVDELGVGKTKFARSVVDTSNPEGTEVAFFVATIAVSVAERFDDALFGEAIATGAIMLHTFSGSKGFLVFSMGWNATFYSHD